MGTAGQAETGLDNCLGLVCGSLAWADLPPAAFLQAASVPVAGSPACTEPRESMLQGERRALEGQLKSLRCFGADSK